MKESLEGLVGKIPGLLDVKVYTEGLASSKNAEVMLDTTFTDEEALKELSESIKEHGVIQPIIVRKINDKYFEIAKNRIDGE